MSNPKHKYRLIMATNSIVQQNLLGLCRLSRKFPLISSSKLENVVRQSHQKCLFNTSSRFISCQQKAETVQNQQQVAVFGSNIDWTHKLKLIEPSQIKPVAKYRILNDDGNLEDEPHPDLDDAKLVQLYKDMVKLNVLDNIMFECQRQGRISFYMTSFGEEAVQLGSAGALEPQDLIFAQYREAGLLVHRNMSLYNMIAQAFGNRDDLGKGRQMPIHYGNKSVNYVTISSPLATQIPQAVGAAYSFKQRGQNNCLTICFFGEGAASEGDAHAGMNFAATLDCPVVFFCRNNGYAISTPAHEQYRSDGIVSRALGYGIAAYRVDGNDLLAVHKVTRKARELALAETRPVLIEAMTYRVGHHSTSDDSLAYRSLDEIKTWQSNLLDPIARFRRHLEVRKLWNQQLDSEEREKWRREVLDGLAKAEKTPKRPISSMFDDVYDEPTLNLVRQRQHLTAHLATYGQHYPLNEYDN